MKDRKFNFIPVPVVPNKEKVLEDRKWYATISFLHNRINFGTKYIRDNGLENKFVRLYYDKSRKTIGWTFINGGKELEALKDLRQIKGVGPKTGRQAGTINQYYLTFGPVEKLKEIFPTKGENGKQVNCISRLNIEIYNQNPGKSYLDTK